MVFNVLSMVTPFFNAIELDLWIVFPSAIGSLNGMPISIAEHNFSSISLIIISLVNSTFGKNLIGSFYNPKVVIIETETNVKENCASWLFKPINLLNKSILYCFILCDF